MDGTATKRILVVANETAEGAQLHETVLARGNGSAEVHVVSPALNSRLKTGLRNVSGACARPGSMRGALSATPTPCRRSPTPSIFSRPTRSSSRRILRSAPTGSNGISSSALAHGMRCRSCGCVSSGAVRRPRSIRAADVSGKRVLVRADLNVHLEHGRVADDTRIRASLPTLQLLLERRAAEVVVCSHLGRPEGEDPAYSMRPVEARLRKLLPDERLRVLENTRFNPGETKNDPGFARELVDDCDLYVNDAFGSAHRAHASTVGVAKLLPAYAGLLLERELQELGKLLGDVEGPFVLISGGVKVEDKLGVLENLGGRADNVLIGGKMAEQIRESNPLDFEVELPVDVVAASEFAEDAETKIVPFESLPEGWLGLDIGPETRERFAQIISRARTIFWNGPRKRSPRRSPRRTRTASSGAPTPSAH